MKIKEIKDLMMHFAESKYDDYNVVFWDYSRQRKMDGHFGALSHPEKEISIPIGVVGDDVWKIVEEGYEPNGLPKTVSTVEGHVADLVESERSFDSISYSAYMYKDRETGKVFYTKLSEVYTMYHFYKAETERYRKFINRYGIVKTLWNESITEEDVVEKDD